MQTAAGTPFHWGLFFVLVLGMMALDLGVFNRRDHRVELREAAVWSVVWTLAALAFNLWVLQRFGAPVGVEFLTAYVIERALSFDNLFVFVLIFNFFAVAAEQQHRVLFWGILGALASRGLFIGLGAALISRFEVLILVFGAFLVYSGIKIFRGGETEAHPESNPVVRAFQRLVPITGSYHGKRFFVRQGGRTWATPLLLVLVVVEVTDVVFAVDSIPAVFGVTRNAFIAFTSNIFAVFGLRALYFLLAGLIRTFRFLGYGLGVVLTFVGAKMLASPWLEIPSALSLAAVLAILAVAVGASLLLPAQPEETGEEVLHDPAENVGEDFAQSAAAREMAADTPAEEELEIGE
jgi:tellurite resistance protein TerC